MLKILHTSDWHLGQKFLFNHREEEHRLALNWLLDTIKTKEIDILIVAGDVFDIGNPPNYARKLYFDFLTAITQTDCRHLIIIGGNHDSPSMLNAPKDLLKYMNIYVVGAATDNIQDEIIELYDNNKKLECVIAAVPFLRDRDLRSATTGESGEERIKQIKKGIYEHYQKAAEAVKQYKDLDIPIIATGHLYAKGATAAEKQDNIYIGNIDNIAADQFPDIFDYVALGHIHRPQRVGKLDQIRYSGSIIPLSFSEIGDNKSIYLVQFEGKKISKKIKPLHVPLSRRLVTIEGQTEDIEERLEALNKKYGQSDLLATWVDIIVQTDKIIPNLDSSLKEFAEEMHLEILKIRVRQAHRPLDIQSEILDLDDLLPLDVFKKKCASTGNLPDEIETLTATFKELQNNMEY